MRGYPRASPLLAVAGTLFMCACGTPGQLGRSVVSPSDVTTRVALTSVPVKGAEISITRLDGTQITGELLAATDDTMTVLDGSSIVRLGVADVRRAIVTRYENESLIGGLTVWAVAGALAGISHGFLLLFSEPIWGGIATGAIVPVAADEGRFAYTERRWDFSFLHEYARFPQGLPPQYTGPPRARITP
jgi:hypothetical protein